MMQDSPRPADDEIDFGYLVFTHRLAKNWSREDLARLYAKALGKPEPLSNDAIEVLERNRRGPVSTTRREILARLLDIPLVFVASQTTPSTQEAPAVIAKDRLDLKEYDRGVAEFYEQHLRDTSVH